MQDLAFIACITERDIDLLVLEELSVNEDFCRWLVSRLPRKPDFAATLGAWHSVCDAALGESDIVYKFITTAGERVAVLIENKIDAPPQPEQAERYKQRGIRGIERGDWDDSTTCILAPRRYLNAAANASLYDFQLAYEEVVGFFEANQLQDPRYAFRARMVREGIEQNRRGYQPEIDDAMTSYVAEYCALAARTYPSLRVQEAKPRPSGGDWILFKPHGMPAGVQLCHQLMPGVVKLIFAPPHTIESIQKTYGPRLEADMSIASAGKSVGISIEVPKLVPRTAPFDTEREKIVSGIESAARLADWLSGISRGPSVE